MHITVRPAVFILEEWSSYAPSVTVTASARTLTICSRATSHDASTCDEESRRPVIGHGVYLLQRLGRLLHHRRLATPSAVDNCCEVCLIGQRDGVALVPCGPHAFLHSAYTRVDKSCQYGHRLPDLSHWYPNGDAPLLTALNTCGSYIARSCFTGTGNCFCACLAPTNTCIA